MILYPLFNDNVNNAAHVCETMISFLPPSICSRQAKSVSALKVSRRILWTFWEVYTILHGFSWSFRTENYFDNQARIWRSSRKNAHAATCLTQHEIEPKSGNTQKFFAKKEKFSPRKRIPSVFPLFNLRNSISSSLNSERNLALWVCESLLVAFRRSFCARPCNRGLNGVA